MLQTHTGCETLFKTLNVGMSAICVVADKTARNEGEAEKTDDAMEQSST